MSTPAPVATTGQTFVSLLLKDIITTGGSPLLTFLSAFGAAAGDPIKIEAAFIALQGAEIGQLTPFESLLSGQIASALTAKIQAQIAKA